ncbi:sigma-E processing peptidase SpoIIGA [Neobacillus sp. PS3-40]|uniref:sigma-E processing peptidase SpoIIGA n=1 Tax=Neobacillus sp. PS3-40 TaxID=3070679 RepID=UPI0027E0EA8D|nr:sigma-E processing peptidase SpoIIGA [Neobacillus sp. PS3-40]WML43622.1 sigma-E processing peptidase SpoIIGA [Neobacillus sp. PS3-40]
MTVYLDVIWVLNFLFDSLLLYLTALFLKRTIRIWRLLAGGFIGSLIILLSFTPLNTISGNPVSKLLCSVAMILAVFGYKRWRFFVRALLTLYFSTFLIGGALIGAHYFIQYDSKLTTNVLISNVQGFGDPISWLFVLIGFPIAWHFSKAKIENMEMAKIQFDQIVSVSLKLYNEIFVFKGLVDSGNQLYDPLSNMPVMFVSIKNQLDSIPEPLKRMTLDPELVLKGDESIPLEWKSQLRVIPCRVVGQEHQLIVAIKPETIMIKTGDRVYECKKGLVSFTMQQLSSDDAFQCIVHPKMLTGPKQRCEEVRVG